MLMSKRLDRVKLVKGPQGHFERLDPLDNIGESTFVLAREAIEEGRTQLAKDLIDYLFVPEVKLVHDAGCNWLWGFPTFIKNNYGEDAVSDAWNGVMSTLRRGQRGGGPLGVKRGVGAEERLIYGYALMTWRMHRMGTYDGLKGFKVREYEDRLELEWDPCSSGGRMMRGDDLIDTQSLLEPPYSLGVTEVPHDWSWNKKGVCLYCAHCAILHAQMDVDRVGIVGWTIDPPTASNPKKVCLWTAYKNEDDVPAAYYKSIGREKPKRTTPQSKPKNPNKVLRVISSD